MTKKILIVLLFLAFVYSSPSWACKASCGGNSCEGTGDCHCDIVAVGGGTVLVPHCTDSAVTPTDEYVDYLLTWDLPGLNRLAAVARDMMKAIEANDLTAYQQALDQHNRVERALSRAERQIYRAFEHPTPEPENRQK